jgi:tRNA(adenine34) deaminase
LTVGESDHGSYDKLMRLALEQAKTAGDHGDVPVGAVLVNGAGDIVAAAHNRREIDGDATAHAEMLAISMASRAAGNWRLADHTLVVTLEPCAMCAMAAVWARVGTIVFGAADLKAGAAWSLYNIPQDQRLNHRIELVGGVLEEECSKVLTNFFDDKR